MPSSLLYAVLLALVLGVGFSSLAQDNPLPKDIPSLKALAEKGDAEAQFMLGATFYFGEGVDVDFKLAVDWYKKSAKQGHPKAQFNLGSAYWYGKGVPKDPVQTYMWWMFSAGEGYALAKEWMPEIAPHLTAAQLAEAKKLVEAGIPTPTQPFTNTLGMKFVPVPGTEVAFCIWETRVMDYAAYAAANAGVDAKWKKPGYPAATGVNISFKQADTHSVVNVSWNDAHAFCAWLTKKELASGKLKAGQKYRLPTDAEWSVAVGLGKETGNTPKEKQLRIKGVYPWGKEWPPPKGAGNYHKEFNADSFDFTAPVGSFSANKFGLHDMGGNVWEWCEDKDRPTSSFRVLRGASWYPPPTDYLLSSSRTRNFSDHRISNFGFRCVLTGKSVLAADKKPLTKEESAKVIEAAIREQIRKPTDELTKADLEKVTKLYLRSNKLTEVPKGLEKLTQLKELNLWDNKLTDVKGLEKLTQLRILHLGGNPLTDVKGLEKLTQLTYLSISNSQLTKLTEGVEKLTQLKRLDLMDNKLTDVEGLEKLTQLKTLWLRDNKLTDVKGLEKLTQLTSLHLFGNPDLTKAQIDQLQKALPNCKILSNAKK